MNTGPHPQLSLASLTDEDMSLLPVSARLLAVVLTMRARLTEPTRLSLPQIKQRVFPFDQAVTIDSLTLDVLALEEIGFLTTLVGEDGRERYLVTPAAVEPQPTAPDPAPTLGHREHIAPVGREGEQSERASARADPPQRRPYRRPPARFCPTHAATNGSGGESCVECRDARMEWTTWHYETTHGPDDLAPDVPLAPTSPSSAAPPRSRRPVFRPSDGAWPDEESDVDSSGIPFQLPY